MNIAIIPARSGSKGLPDKNIKLLGNMPLLAHSVQSALKSRLFDEILVSTDSREYAEIAEHYGGSVPYLREKLLSEDTTPMWDVVRDALYKYEASGQHFNTVTLLQPTSPLRTSVDIIKAHELYTKNQADSVVSVCKADYSPHLCNMLPENNSLNGFIKPEMISRQRQQLPEYYRINGAIYVIRCSYLAKSTDIYASRAYAYIMPRERSIDIDDELDFILAEALYNRVVVQ